MNSAFCGFVWPAKLVEKARGPFIYYVSISRGNGVRKSLLQISLWREEGGGAAKAPAPLDEFSIATHPRRAGP